jgi:hypothetical protein
MAEYPSVRDDRQDLTAVLAQILDATRQRIMAEFPSVRDALRHAAWSEDAKVSKASVAYEHPAAKANHCGICEHWQPPRQPPHSCAIVRGRIQPEDWCKRFRKAK